MMQLKKFFFFCVSSVAVGAISFVGPLANAGKLAVSGGAYSFTAENASNRVSATLSGLGSYQISYKYELMQNVELDVGFSLLATDTFGGDLAFGFDVGANYFFLTSTGVISLDSADGSIFLNSRWRPFVGVSFNQRNFQSTTSQYAGFGVKGGTEYQYDEQIAILGMARFLSLGGPNQSGATQIDMLGGIILQF